MTDPSADGELSSNVEFAPEIFEAIERINGRAIEEALIAVASTSDAPQVAPIEGQSVRFAPNRVALSDADVYVREEITEPRMRELGLEVETHPMGSIGIWPGKNPDAAPLVLWSHNDTVGAADMYDGTAGIEASLIAVETLQDAGFEPERPIMVIALTGEESVGFGTALFGSRSMFLGLDDQFLDARLKDGPSIRESVAERYGEEAIEQIRNPLFGEGRRFKMPHAVLELHVEQGAELDEREISIGLVEGIASPIRYEVPIGVKDPENVPVDNTDDDVFIRVTVEGSANHSGTTPMGDKRQDGLWGAQGVHGLVDRYARDLDAYGNGETGVYLSSFAVAEGKMNSVPGRVSFDIKIEGQTHDAAIEAAVILEKHYLISDSNDLINTTPNNVAGNLPFTVERVSAVEAGVFYSKPGITAQNQEVARRLIRNVERHSRKRSDQGVVGTVGDIVDNGDGTFTALVDVRSQDVEARAGVIHDVERSLGISLGEPLPGDTDPVILDPDILQTMQDVAEATRISNYITMSSKAGHDTQNAQRAGAPSGMIFIPSRWGIAHNPNAYTDPADLEKGTKLLTAVAAKLAS